MSDRQQIDTALAGRRVRFVSTTDEHTALRPGDEGEVIYVNNYNLGHGPMSTLAVKWDNGSSLGLIFDVDRWEVLP